MKREHHAHSHEWTFTLGHEELVIHHRYEVLSIANDILLGIWFTVGSICFFSEGNVKTLGVWLFLIGSMQLLCRPLIRLHRYIRLKRLPSASQDY